MSLEILIILLFVVATAVAIAARRLGVPYTAALVATGLVLGALHVLDPPHLTEEMLFAIFLPGLIFEAAFHLEFRSFWRDRLVIASLAVPGVLVSLGLTAALLVASARLLPAGGEFTWPVALIFGSLIAATDPIAVVGLFRSMGAPRRLSTLMEGESLLNDGTAIVVFSLILGAVLGNHTDTSSLVLEFLTVVGMGALIGGLMGTSAAHVIQRINDPMIETTLTTIAAYGSFLLAEQLHYSGVIATVVAGLIVGNYAAQTGMAPSTRLAVETFWEYVAFALNSLVFLLIGFEVSLPALVAAWRPILLGFLAVTMARALVIGAITLVLARSRHRIPKAWALVLTWGGLRGAISMVLVLGLPAALGARSELITVTFGVVVLSILLNGLTMGPLMRRLGIGHSSEEWASYRRERARTQVAREALAEIDRMEATRFTHAGVLKRLREEYTEQMEEGERRLKSLHVKRHELAEEELRRARRHLALHTKDFALDAVRTGSIARETYDSLLPDLDAEMLDVESE